MRIAILGGGAVTRIFYLPAFHAGLHGLRLAAIIDASSDALGKLKNPPDGAELLCTSFQKYLDDLKPGSIDAVVVALPHHLHDVAVCLSLQKELHVLCEKPLALKVSSVNRMCEMARQVGRVLAVCHFRRHFPANAAIRELIASRKFGKCLSVDWREGGPYAWPVESLSQIRMENGGEVLFDIGAHVFEIITSWFNDCTVLGCKDD